MLWIRVTRIPQQGTARVKLTIPGYKTHTLQKLCGHEDPEEVRAFSSPPERSCARLSEPPPPPPSRRLSLQVCRGWGQRSGGRCQSACRWAFRGRGRGGRDSPGRRLRFLLLDMGRDLLQMVWARGSEQQRGEAGEGRRTRGVRQSPGSMRVRRVARGVSPRMASMRLSLPPSPPQARPAT